MWTLSPVQCGRSIVNDSSARSVSSYLVMTSFFTGFISASKSLSVSFALPMPLLFFHAIVIFPLLPVRVGAWIWVRLHCTFPTCTDDGAYFS